MTSTKVQLTPEFAIINFVYFTANFHTEFIKECWNDQPHMQKVVEEKFISHAKGNIMDCGDFIRFFFDLDKGNQFKLAKWINEHYRGI